MTINVEEILNKLSPNQKINYDKTLSLNNSYF